MSKVIYCKDAVEPFKGTKESIGIDLKASEDCKIAPNTCYLMPLGVKTDFEFMLAARSSLWKKWLIIADWVGIIDEDYRGEVLIPVYNYTNSSINISEGERVAQIVVLDKKERGNIEIVKVTEEEYDNWAESNPTERWDGGFGSTKEESKVEVEEEEVLVKETKKRWRKSKNQA